jgi:hypothetical protein
MLEAWKIGVKVSVVDGVSAGLRGISSAFMKTEGDAARFEKRIKSIQSQALKGGMMLGAGVGILAMFKAPLEEAEKFQTQIAKFTLYGLGDKMTAQAVQYAKGMNIVGTSATDAMKAVNEAQGVFRESGLSGTAALAGAKLAAPVLAKIDFASSALDDESKARMHTQGLDMLRFIEVRGGLSSPEEFKSIANAGWKAIRSSGGNVAWGQLRQFMSAGGVAAQGLSGQALFGEMEPIIGEMKGGAAGQALMTSFSRMEGLQRLMPRIFQHEILRLGLWDRSKLTFNSQGGIKEMKGNPLVDSSLFSSSPFEYYQQMVLPAYAKAGITKPEDIFRENAVLFGNTGGKMFSIMYRQQQQIEQSVAAQAKTLSIDASVGVASKTLPAKKIDFNAKYANLMLQLGDTVLPLACTALERLIPLVKSLTDWMDKNRSTVKWVAEAFVGLGVALAIGGTVMVMTSAIRGLGLALQFAGIGGAGGVARLGSNLTQAAKGFGALSVAADAFIAWQVGWAIGRYIDNNIITPATSAATGGKDDNYFDLVHKQFYRFDPKTGQREFSLWKGLSGTKDELQQETAEEDNYLRTSHNTRAIQVHSTINIDGKTLAKVVTQHQTRAATGPQTGTSGFDTSQQATPIGVSGSW